MAGADGAGDQLPAGCEELGSPGSTGRQCDPGTEGNGTFFQEEPENGTPPEAEGDVQGTLTGSENFASTVFGYGFNYRIHVPPQYEAGKPAALVVFQDGSNYINNFRAPQVIESLIADGSMPVAIGLYIEPGNARSVEYDSTNTNYADFIIDEIVPSVVASAYDLVDDPHGWSIGGHSSGGAAAFTTGWHYPDKFRKILTHNGSFVGLQDPGADEYIDEVLVEDIRPLRVNMLSGTNDLGGGTWFNANNAMAESLEEAGYVYRYMSGEGSHDPRPWASADLPAALRWLWRGYTLPHYETGSN
jgi:enterochelin esterase family protein